MALSRIFVASVVTWRNSLFTVVEDGGYSNGRNCGRVRNAQDAIWQDRAWSIDTSGTRGAKFPPVPWRGLLRTARTRLPPIDRTFPVAHTFRRLFVDSRIGQACADSAIRVSHTRVNKKRPLLAFVTAKKCAAASLPRRMPMRQRLNSGTKVVGSGPV
jgi:hypothetical protein